MSTVYKATFGHSLFYASIAFGGEWKNSTQNALKVTAKVKQKMLLFTPGLKTNNFRVYGLFIHVTGKQHHQDKHCHHRSPHPPLPPSPPHPHPHPRPHPPHHHHHLVPNHEIITNQMLSSDTPNSLNAGDGMEPSGLVTWNLGQAEVFLVWKLFYDILRTSHTFKLLAHTLPSGHATMMPSFLMMSPVSATNLGAHQIIPALSQNDPRLCSNRDCRSTPPKANIWTWKSLGKGKTSTQSTVFWVFSHSKLSSLEKMRSMISTQKDRFRRSADNFCQNKTSRSQVQTWLVIWL